MLKNEYFFHTDVKPKFTYSSENNWFQFLLLFYFIYAKYSILVKWDKNITLGIIKKNWLTKLKTCNITNLNIYFKMRFHNFMQRFKVNNNLQ